MSETTPITVSQDALYLWDDTMRLLSQEANSSRRVAMMNACEPVELSDDTLTVRTPSAYAKRSLESELKKLETALSQAAFQPMHLVIDYARDGWQGGPGLAFQDTGGPGAAASAVAPAQPAGSTVPTAVAAPANSEVLEPSPATSPLAPGKTEAVNKTQRSALPKPEAPAPTLFPMNFQDEDSSRTIPLGMATTALSKDEFLDRLGTGNAAAPNAQLSFPQISGTPTEGAPLPAPSHASTRPAPAKTPKPNPLDTVLGDNDSKLTFDTFIEGVENQFALAAAKEVANGNTPQYNPLFIYGNSGLGKTHLLMSIKNYIATNDPSRVCVYRIAQDFRNDYSKAMTGDKLIKDAFTQQYRDIDVLILDDVQHLKTAAQTLEFFFDTFNYLISYGKQIVIAADVPPAELGMEERITSRMGQGFEVSIQMPSPELKLNLVSAFYERAKQEALPGYEGTIANTVLNVMAESSGDNIRTIKAYVQQCLFVASTLEKKGATLTADDARALAKERWPHGHHRVTVKEIQSLVEREMGVGHAELVSTKRTKDIAQARHVAIWLCRQLTDLTFNEIGSHFGNRTHTTCMHSIEWVDNLFARRTDRHLIETVTALRRRLETL